MVPAPDELVGILAHLEERQAHQERSRKIEAPRAAIRAIRLQARCLLFQRVFAPVGDLPGQLDLPAYNLYGCVQALPRQARAQDRMAIDHLPPGMLERG